MIDEILEALENERWHSFIEIFDTANMIAGRKELQINQKQLRITLEFLEKFEFIEKQTGTPLWRLVPSVQQFLQRVKQLELEQPI